MQWMKFRPLFFLISGIGLLLSLYSIFTWGFKPSIDFTGGTVIEYKFTSQTSPDLLKTILEAKAKDYGYKDITAISDTNIQLRFGPELNQERAEVLTALIAEAFPERPELVRFETIGPVLSKEILGKTYMAVGIAGLGILLWVALQFKSFKLGITAILAVVHDLIILLGIFAYLGWSRGVEIDVLFVTAFLTVFALSLYDTIVVYDRIRESSRRFSGMGIGFVADKAITNTIVRSFNTSVTTGIVLFALVLLGASSIKWFALALLVGLVSGTYSSPFVAVPLLVTWEEVKNRLKQTKQHDKAQ